MKVVEESICCSNTKVFIGRAITREVLENEISGKVLLIRQDAVDPRYVVDAVKTKLYEIVLPGGEEAKDLSTVMQIMKFLSEKEFQRKDYIIALGGGALTDVAGFAASIYMRGIRLINIPTTLLGMVDAALGGKNAINFHGIKNVVGSFYQPYIVISDLLYLDTLPGREFVNGLAEVIKYGTVLDYELFRYLSENSAKILTRDYEAIEYIVYRSTLNKVSIVKRDPYELQNTRMVLNYGHTIGHAIEAATNFTIPHGMAVAIGMVCEAVIGIDLSITDREVLTELTNILKKYGLPTSVDELNTKVDKQILFSAMLKDKKRHGDYISLPIPLSLGSWTLYRISIDELRSAVERCPG